ncbi:hypothetical protein PVL29_016171 [Vitis rotundifolia]|uniref:Uncharacterized protein n=1 Tax=Vitis rotundifolia TaxID=103349 RepID=A0AA39DMN0_VITRO|nr:hypothetical protein PVL29_016171 [Vitis rotundifolia]
MWCPTIHLIGGSASSLKPFRPEIRLCISARNQALHFVMPHSSPEFELTRILQSANSQFQGDLLLLMQTWTETHYGSRKKWILLADQGAVGIGWLIQLHDLMKSRSNGDLDDGLGYSAP